MLLAQRLLLPLDLELIERSIASAYVDISPPKARTLSYRHAELDQLIIDLYVVLSSNLAPSYHAPTNRIATLAWRPIM